MEVEDSLDQHLPGLRNAVALFLFSQRATIKEMAKQFDDISPTAMTALMTGAIEAVHQLALRDLQKHQEPPDNLLSIYDILRGISYNLCLGNEVTAGTLLQELLRLQAELNVPSNFEG